MIFNFIEIVVHLIFCLNLRLMCLKKTTILLYYTSCTVYVCKLVTFIQKTKSKNILKYPKSFLWRLIYVSFRRTFNL